MTQPRAPRRTAGPLTLALLIAGLAAAAAAPSAHAQTSAPVVAGPYVGAALGLGFTNFRSDDFSPAVIAGSLGLPTGSLTRSDSPRKLGYKFTAGYRVNEWFSAEVGAADLGKARIDYRVPALDVDANGRYRVRALTLAGVASTPVTPDIAVFGKLGVAHTQTRNEFVVKAAGLSESDAATKRKTNLYAGVGAEYRLNPAVSVVGEYEYFGTAGNADDTGRARAQLVSVGLRYAF